MTTNKRTGNFIFDIGMTIFRRFRLMIENFSDFNEDFLGLFANFLVRWRMRSIILMEKGKLVYFPSVFFRNSPRIFFHFFACIVAKMKHLI